MEERRDKMKRDNIFRIRTFLNTIEYNPVENYSYDDFLKKFVQCLLRTKTIFDSNELLIEFNYFLKNEKKVKKLLEKKKKSLFDITDYNYTLRLDLCDDEAGNYLVTTLISNYHKRPVYFDSDDLDYYDTHFKGKMYKIFTEGEYCLKHKTNKVTIYKNDFEVLTMKSSIDSYRVSYNSLGIQIKEDNLLFELYKGDSKNDDNLVCLIDVDLIKEMKQIGSAMINVFDDDYELYITIGLAVLLLTQDQVVLRKNIMIHTMINR